MLIDFFNKSINEIKFIRQSRSNQRRVGGAFHIHSDVPYRNATIFIGSGHSVNDENNPNANGDLGNFLQTILTQIAGGFTGGPGPQLSPL